MLSVFISSVDAFNQSALKHGECSRLDVLFHNLSSTSTTVKMFGLSYLLCETNSAADIPLYSSAIQGKLFG